MKLLSLSLASALMSSLLIAQSADPQQKLYSVKEEGYITTLEKEIKDNPIAFGMYRGSSQREYVEFGYGLCSRYNTYGEALSNIPLNIPYPIRLLYSGSIYSAFTNLCPGR